MEPTKCNTVQISLVFRQILYNTIRHMCACCTHTRHLLDRYYLLPLLHDLSELNQLKRGYTNKDLIRAKNRKRVAKRKSLIMFGKSTSVDNQHAMRDQKHHLFQTGSGKWLTSDLYHHSIKYMTTYNLQKDVNKNTGYDDWTTMIRSVSQQIFNPTPIWDNM